MFYHVLACKSSSFTKLKNKFDISCSSFFLTYWEMTCIATLPSSMPNLVTPTDPNVIPSMERLVQSESIQYNWVWSKDLHFADMNKNSICH